MSAHGKTSRGMAISRIPCYTIVFYYTRLDYVILHSAVLYYIPYKALPGTETNMSDTSMTEVVVTDAGCTVGD